MDMKYPMLTKILASGRSVFVVLVHHKHGVSSFAFSTSEKATQAVAAIESLEDFEDGDYCEIVEAIVDEPVTAL